MADVTLATLGSIAERRWGLVTTAQAEDAGVSRKQLARMASAGALERVAQGVYRMPGAPPQEREAIYATWLALGGATAPRTETGVAPLVAAGQTAAVVHGIGDFLPDGFDFIVPARKGTRLPGVRLRTRRLTRDEVIPVGGLPALTVERTLADLVEIGTDLSLVAGAARDAVRADKLVAPDLLEFYLDPVAARRKSDGRSLAGDLLELAGVRSGDGVIAERGSKGYATGYHTRWARPRDAADGPERIAIREALAFGKALYDVRTALGLTVADLALRVAMTGDDIERMEEGSTEPTIPLLRLFAAALNADVRLTGRHDPGSVRFETYAD